MKYSDLEKNFSFQLPEDLIAKFPLEKRDESRLMIINRKLGKINTSLQFKDIGEMLSKDDTLVYNNTRVSNRRFYLHNSKDKEFECIFLDPIELSSNFSCWKVLIKNQRKLKNLEELFLKNTNQKFTYFKNQLNEAYLKAEFKIDESFFLNNGNIPIPPYFKRRSQEVDNIRYQTVFANDSSSIAAPTAGLHFTEELVEKLKSRGVIFKNVELQIAYGTFAPLTEENFNTKKLHKEKYFITEQVAFELNNRNRDSKLIAVGTTSLRTLESSFNYENQKFEKLTGSTELFITPGDQIYSIDGLITNFHLPASSLLLLVAAFAGTELILEAYNIAIKEKFRFFSYGDAMLIL